MIDVVGIGCPVMDMVVNIPRIPAGSDYTPANEIFTQGGGNCATAMAAASRLGFKTGMIAKVGGDKTGDFIIGDFRFHGVDTSRILRGPPETSSPICICVSEIELGTRFFIGRKSIVPRLEPEDLDYGYIAGAKVLHIENGSPASAAAAKFARQKGITVTMDAGGFSPDRLAIMPDVDIYIASENFYNGMFKDNPGDLEGNCRKLRDMGPPVVWITRGPLGCCGLADGKFYNVPAFDVPVLDTTGAGDVFHGAYIAAFLEGLTHPECVRYANAVAAIKCMFPGGRTGIPDRKTLERFLKDGKVMTEDLEKRLEYYSKSFIENMYAPG